ncbi:phage portal protein [Mycolicibacterium canariasense]|nr:phage portal protein [Mycolicibacterium canariasense]
MYGGFGYPGSGYKETLSDGKATERPANNFEGLTRGAYQANGVVFSCMLARQLVFSGMRFQWQQMLNGSPSDTFGNRELRVLERPWGGGTTQDLLSRLIQDADLAGNSYWVRQGDELVRLRPDWVRIVGQRRYMNQTGRATDLNRGDGQVGWVKIGYLYNEGGWHQSDSKIEPVAFTVDEVAHFAPIPDPLSDVAAGMSWLTPILREIQADQAMTNHQTKYMDNAATPNMVIRHFAGVSGVKGATQEAVKAWVAEFEDKHAGPGNSGKTLHLYPGAEVTIAGAHLKEIDFANVRGGGEVRVAAAAGVPPVIAGLSKGLESSTYSNYSQARRRFADGTIHPLWQNASGTMERVLTVPSDSTRLWYDSTDVPFLREDEKDAAAIAAIKASTINSYITAGYEPDSVVLAVESNDLRLLKHSGRYSVQLQPPGSTNGQQSQDDQGRGADITLAEVRRILELITPAEQPALPAGSTEEEP